MATTLVTGGTGFIGSHVARALVRRGDDVRVLVRKGSSREALAGVDVAWATGDVLDRRSVRRAMKGVERVFHVAGLLSLRREDRDRVFDVNVTGTRTVLEEALRAGVERAVYTSSVAAIGPAPQGGVADESLLFTAGSLGIPYVNAMHEGEVEAMRLAAQGLPLVAVHPAFVFGPGDRRSSSTSLVRRFLLGRIPAYVDGGLCVVDVRDVAQAQLLADRKGKVGERYILGGRNFTSIRLFADLGRFSGTPLPANVPGRAAQGAAVAAERLGLPTPISSHEVAAARQWWTYRTGKARKALGFRPRPHDETLEDAVSWHLDRMAAEGHEMRRSRGAGARRMALRGLAAGGRLADRRLK